MNPDLLRQYLEFYQDLGVKTIYRRTAQAHSAVEAPLASGEQAENSVPLSLTFASRGRLR